MSLTNWHTFPIFHRRKSPCENLKKTDKWITLNAAFKASILVDIFAGLSIPPTFSTVPRSSCFFSTLYGVYVFIRCHVYWIWTLVCFFIEFRRLQLNCFSRDFRKRAVRYLRVTKMFLLGRRKICFTYIFFSRAALRVTFVVLRVEKLSFSIIDAKNHAISRP